MKVKDLKIGDQFWGDYTSVDGTRIIHENGLVYKIMAEPSVSVNTSLFWDSIDSSCVVVGVEYADGARGSRLFDPEAELIVRRPRQS